MRLKLKLGRKEDEIQEKAEEKVIRYADLLFPILSLYVQASMFKTVNPHKAYFWLRSSNAHLFAEAMAKNDLKLILDFIQPIKDDFRKYFLFVVLIMAFALAVIAIWIFTHGGVSVPTIPKPPTVPAGSKPVVINK